ncbi:very short patch repair endonuclease [Schleiferilactobacillus harbinensis]|nr:very short patch repair endonuclease [Schleiferilactobacillus harbinensis]MBO3093170.1 very short patch repair endonuclease [Schleiferilactobacillus harbinensis]
MGVKLKTTAYRSQMMSKIRSTGGKAETMLAKMLWHSGIRYRRNYRPLPGKPDIAITKYRVAVFVDGEFWHGYDWANQKEKRIHRNREYWIPKIERNMARDREEETELKAMGWTVLRFWEKHQVLKDPEACVDAVLATVEKVKSANHTG